MIKLFNKKAFSTVFSKIIKKEIKADIVYETDSVLVFKDIAPVAPIHLLIIPKKEIKSISSAQDEDRNILGDLLLTANKVADQIGIKDEGFRIVINDGKNGCQSVDHIHLHLIGGKQLGWPPGVDEKMKKI